MRPTCGTQCATRWVRFGTGWWTWGTQCARNSNRLWAGLTRGDRGSAFWVLLSLLLLQLLCELSLPLLPLLSLWLSLLSDEELCASNSEALGSNTTGCANRHWRTGITRRAGRPSHVSGGAKWLPAASTTAGRGCFFLCRRSLRELKARRLPKPRTGQETTTS